MDPIMDRNMDSDQSIEDLRNTNAWLTQRVAELEREKNKAQNVPWRASYVCAIKQRDEARREAERLRGHLADAVAQLRTIRLEGVKSCVLMKVNSLLPAWDAAINGKGGAR